MYVLWYSPAARVPRFPIIRSCACLGDSSDQDETLEKLSKGIGNLQDIGGAIGEEVDLQTVRPTCRLHIVHNYRFRASSTVLANLPPFMFERRLYMDVS